MRAILISLALSCALNISAQDKNYSAKTVRKSVSMLSQVLEGKEIDVNGTPLGKNVRLTYDSFFKTYTFSFTNSDGNKETIKQSLVAKNNKAKADGYTDIKDEVKTRKRLEINTTDGTYIFEGVIVLK